MESRCCSGLKPVGGKLFPCAGPVWKQRGVRPLCRGSSWPRGGRNRGSGCSPTATGVCPPSPQPCHLLSKTARALCLKKTTLFTPVTPSEPAENLPGWPGRSCHLPPSLNSFLASFYKCVFVPALFFSFTLFFSLRDVYLVPGCIYRWQRITR